MNIDKPCVTFETQNPGILTILEYLKSDTYSEPSQRFKMECFAKIVKCYTYFKKALSMYCMRNI